MKNINEVFSRVKKCIKKSTGIEESQVQLDQRLVNDLKVDSIDMMDLLFELESEFGIKITIGEFEKMARQNAGSEPFEVDQILTDHGLRVLRELMPEVKGEFFKKGMMLQEIPYLFTVHSICSLVLRKLDQSKS